MPRILGTDLPKEKRIDAALPYIYGIGPKTARNILDTAQVSHNKRAKDLSEEEVSRIAGIIQKNYKIEGELRQEVNQNVRRLIEIGSYRGFRHKKGLPSRGQRTRTNSRTRKGRKSSVGTIKKPTKAEG